MSGLSQEGTEKYPVGRSGPIIVYSYTHNGWIYSFLCYAMAIHHMTSGLQLQEAVVCFNNFHI